jgi:hypothetical protein
VGRLENAEKARGLLQRQTMIVGVHQRVEVQVQRNRAPLIRRVIRHVKNHGQLPVEGKGEGKEWSVVDAERFVAEPR